MHWTTLKHSPEYLYSTYSKYLVKGHMYLLEAFIEFIGESSSHSQ